jgi:gamma-glutamylcyclotransferase (GGCT)/AIG2-like uncharacterized protein YtfP
VGHQDYYKPVDLLFVYGTLRSEFDNSYAVLLRERGQLLKKSVIAGSIFRVADYPGYRPEPPGSVHGEVYRVDSDLLQVLDEYEGGDFQRVMIDEMWVYQYLRQTSPESRIASGDYCQP